ncbi:MAG: DUF3563 family protein [Burkholderiales bacterium]
MSKIVKQLFAWLERSAHSAQQREMERYLSQATDTVDLEKRMRQLERC